jgi:PAS domain S-box-containing protein
MTRKRELSERSAELRQVAETLAQKKIRLQRDIELIAPETMQQNLHELGVYQIELELQNEELRRTQVELDEARARYFDLYHLAPVGYFTLNELNVILECNLTAATLLDVDRSKFLGKRFNPFILREDANIFERYRKEILDSGAPQSWEMRLVRSNGSPFWAHIVASMAQESGARVFRVVISDITERKTSEETNAKLEARLQHAQRMELIGRLAGGVAHDFNNMLGVILGHVDAALPQLEPSQSLYADLQEIRHAAEQSARIAKQLLAFARKDAATPEVLNVNDIIARMLPTLQRLVGPNIEFEWRPAATVWLVNADVSQIEQMLVNLCVNARDATGVTGRISIATENHRIMVTQRDGEGRQPAGDYVRLTVTDNGSGIDHETLPHIFEPFFTTKGVGKGTGLGLAIVYGMVQQNGGSIDVFSQGGSGTTIAIQLPRHKTEVPQPRRDIVLTKPEKGGETILLVDDEPSLLRVCERLLKQLGYNVVAARSPGEALRQAREATQEIHLILSDLLMPEMTGNELAEKLSLLLPGAKVLLMSGYASNLLVEAEGVFFIQKPFTKEELAAKIRETLDGPALASAR